MRLAQENLNANSAAPILPVEHEEQLPARPGIVENFYEQFVPELLESYAAIGGLNNRDAHNMPSTRAVGQICEDLLQLLFPGFHDDDAVHHGTLAELTDERFSKVGVRLEDQIRKSVRIGDSKKPTGRPAKFSPALNFWKF